MRTVLISALVLCAARASAADQKAQDEVEGQIAKLAPPPPDVEIAFEPLNEKRYTLLSGMFDLDGDSLPFDVKSPTAPLFHGTLTPGPHRVSVKLVYKEAQGDGLFEYADYKLTIQGSVKLIAQEGLRTHLGVTVTLNPDAERKKRLSIASHVQSEMLAALDDAPVPDVVPPATAAPAPVAVAAATPPPVPVAPEPPAASDDSSGKRKGTRHALAPRAPVVAAAPIAPAAAAPSEPPAALPPPLPPTPEPVAMVPPPAPVVPPVPAAAASGPMDSRQLLGLGLLGASVAAGLAWLFLRRRA